MHVPAGAEIVILPMARHPGAEPEVVVKTPRSHAWRRRALLGMWWSPVVWRAFQLQVLEGEAWRARAVGQQRQRVELPAPRGTIYDRNGVPLAATREAYRIAVAPKEVRDANALVARLREVLGLTAAQARRAVDPKRSWVILPGRYDEVARQQLAGEPGVHFERVIERLYPHGELAMELIGRVGADGRAQGGIELEFDSLLAGRPGEAVARRDVLGRPIPGAVIPVHPPVPGHDVVLTIDYALQEIADDALRRAIEKTEAAGGDLVLADPETGEILAAATVRRDGPRNWLAVTEPYEPGSTIKPFVAAALLNERRVTMADSVYAEQGRYVNGGRTITDVNGYGWLTLRDALRYSSNIAMAKVAERLEPAEQYAYLRDFGFGTPTGGVYRRRRGRCAGRSGGHGIRRAVWRWGTKSRSRRFRWCWRTVRSRTAACSWSRAWCAKSTRGAGGRRYAAAGPPRGARRGRAGDQRALVDVGGTGQAAGLGPFQVAGRRARRARSGRPLRSGSYTASFAGFFRLTTRSSLPGPPGPAEGRVLSGSAAPVMRATLGGRAGRARDALDRRAVAAAVAPSGRRSRQRRAGRGRGRPARTLPAVATPPRRSVHLRDERRAAAQDR